MGSHSVDIPRLLADFHADHPNVEITLGTDSSDNLIENVRTGRLDAAIVSAGPDEVPEGLEVEVVTDEAIQAAVCRTDPLAKRTRIRLADLRDRALIAFEASTPLALADLAERGLGVAIVPASVPRGRDELRALAIVPEIRGRLVLAWRSGGPMSPAARVLVEKARRLLRVSARA